MGWHECSFAPVVSIQFVSDMNEVYFHFTEPMKLIELDKSWIQVKIESISNPSVQFDFEILDFTFTSYSSSKEALLNLSTTVFGFKQENLTVIFQKDKFKSSKGLNLQNDLVWSYPNYPPEKPQMKKAGPSIERILLFTILAVVILNSVFGGEGEFMWGMMNTLQIIFYFPILSHFFPIHLQQFLGYFKAVKLDFDIPI